MSKRQWIWLAVALVLFIAIGAYTAWETNRAQLRTAEMISGIFDSALDELWAEPDAAFFPETDFIARIDIEGTIVSDGSTAGVLYGDGFSESYILDYIDSLAECPNNIGILLFIDSGGGEMKASDEIYLKLLSYKSETGRPVYAYFDGTACSGAYYIAMAADHIFANRNCICVNIGVYIETYNLAGLFEKYGVEEIMIKSSENKGIGAMGQPWTEEQLAIYQSIVDLYYDQFLDVVASGRHMTKEQVRTLDDGREMLALQAYQAGFIDGIGQYDDYVQQLLGYYDGAELYYEPPVSAAMTLLDMLYGRLEALLPVSDGQLLRDFVSSQDGITVMAYAG